MWGAMKVFEFVPEGMSGCNVKAWLHDYEGVEGITQRNYPAVIVCPGGGYNHISPRESEPIAIEYYRAGYNTFILTYTVGEGVKGFTPLKQLATTIAQIRANADAWETRPDQIAVCGFSAGGHLACSLGTMFNKEKFLQAFGRTDHIRPDAMILGYPLILTDENGSSRALRLISGAEPGTEEYHWFGLDQHVDSETPPTFMWHTVTDPVVPIVNTIKLAEALSAAKVPFEYHVLPFGGHGLGTCKKEINQTAYPYNERWMEWSIRWLNQLFDYEL